MKKFLKNVLVFSPLCLFISCQDHSFTEGKYFAGGKYVEAESLNKGKMLYTEYCMACHGAKGDGKGISAKGLLPPPRDFTLGVYKFGNVISGELPTDEDFKKIIRNGLHGTAMLPWDLLDQQLDDVISYIKTFAPTVWEGKDKKVGEPIALTKDPYGPAHFESAIERGKEVYHAVAQCQSCHQAYVSHDELKDIYKRVNNETVTQFDENLYKIKPQDSQYGVKTNPPDFTWDLVRSATTVEELYLRISAGVGGTAMPSWKDTLKDEDIWAVAHYVHHLTTLRDSQKREELIVQLK